MARTDCRRLLQCLAFSESRHFSWDKDPTNTMAYDNDRVMILFTRILLFSGVIESFINVMRELTSLTVKTRC